MMMLMLMRRQELLIMTFFHDMLPSLLRHSLEVETTMLEDVVFV